MHALVNALNLDTFKNIPTLIMEIKHDIKLIYL